MKITKKFREWFKIYGWMGDYWNMEIWQSRRIYKIAWRAYRKGYKDALKNLSPERMYSEK